MPRFMSSLAAVRQLQLNMALITVLEELDEGLALVQLLKKEQSDQELPEHDRLYLEKAEEVKAAEKKESEQTQDQDDPAASEDPVEKGSAEPEGEVIGGSDNSEDDTGEEVSSDAQEVDGKQTTVAAESLRNDEGYSVYSAESFGEETLTSKAAGLAWTGVKALSGYALELATHLGVFLKELGIEYGPKVFAALRKGVSYLLTRIFNSFMKMRAATTKAYFQYKNSFVSHQKRLSRLKQILNELPDNVTVVQDQPFSDQDLFKLFLVGTEVSPVKSLRSVDLLLDVVVNDIDRGVQHEIGVMQQVIDVCKRNARVEVLHYLQSNALNSGFMKKSIAGYDKDPERVESFMFNHALPCNVLLLAGIPRKDVIERAVRDEDLHEVSEAYKGSYLVLGVNPLVPKIAPMVNYMDKQSLLRLLDGLEGVVEKALKHVSFYQKLETASNELKPSFQNYFSWLVEDAQAKSLRESLAEVIYLKQSFVTKVYLPGAIDIHEFVSSYVSGVLRYVERNIKVMKPADQESAA